MAGIKNPDLKDIAALFGAEDKHRWLTYHFPGTAAPTSHPWGDKCEIATLYEFAGFVASMPVYYESPALGKKVVPYRTFQGVLEYECNDGTLGFPLCTSSLKVHLA